MQHRSSPTVVATQWHPPPPLWTAPPLNCLPSVIWSVTKPTHPSVCLQFVALCAKMLCWGGHPPLTPPNHQPPKDSLRPAIYLFILSSIHCTPFRLLDWNHQSGWLDDRGTALSPSRSGMLQQVLQVYGGLCFKGGGNGLLSRAKQGFSLQLGMDYTLASHYHTHTPVFLPESGGSNLFFWRSTTNVQAMYPSLTPTNLFFIPLHPFRSTIIT